MALCPFYLGAQSLDKAHKQYEGYNFIEAAKLYRRIAESGHTSPELYRRLGNIFYFKGDYTEAEKWYSKLDMEKQLDDPEYQLRYAQSLKSVGKIGESQRVYNNYLNSAGTLHDALSSSEDYSKIISENGNRYSIFPLDVNSEGIDYGSFVQEGTLYFSSSRSLKRKKIIDTWSGRPFLDIYAIAMGTDGRTTGEPRAIKGKVNTKLHESSPVITRDGNTMYFTRSNTTPMLRAGKNDNQKLKIYRAKRINGKWDDIEDLSINSDTYSNAHPALSPDEKTLYFVSDMPRSYGATDIFMVRINTDGSLGKPINMGTLVNTKGRESFPFITERDELYFSSDGHLGLGGYDVFYVNLGKGEKQLLNLGKPINGPYDDYAFSLDNSTKRGIFSSNREGTDNIYGLLEIQPIEDLPYTEIKGLVTDKATGVPIKGAKVLLIGHDDKTLLMANTDNNGEYTLKADKRKSFKVKVEKRDYRTTGRFVKRMLASGDTDFQLDKNRIELVELLDFGNIYFDFNSSYLRKEAKATLDTIAQALMDIPNLKQIEVNSHADSRGTKKYNLWLSERRSKRVVDYLVGKGVEPTRIKAFARGEELLVNDCGDNVDCPENSHQLNRRTEFIIK